MEKIIEIPEGYEARIEGNKVVLEPKESEDERMLREISRYIKEQGDKPSGLPNGTVCVADMLAYLEKQKERKISRWKPVGECSDIPDFHYVVGWFRSRDIRLGIMCDGLFVDTDGNRAEQPKEVFYLPNGDEELVYLEHKPVDYAEELKKCRDNSFYFFDKYVKVKQKPAEWSKEDEKALSAVISLMISSRAVDPFYDKMCLKDWLNSLPKRFDLQPKQEDRYIEGYQKGFADAEKVYNNGVPYYIGNPNIYKLDPNVVIDSTTGGTYVACHCWKPSEE